MSAPRSPDDPPAATSGRWPYLAIVALLFVAALVFLFAVGPRKGSTSDDTVAVAPHDPSRKVAPKSTASPESPMITTASPNGSPDATIAAPLTVKAPPPDAERTASGLASKSLYPGTGQVHPTPQSKVKVHYSGWTTDGKMIDSSITRGAPATFPLSAVIKGWTEGVQLMVMGEQRRFWIPADLAYGNTAGAGAPVGMLVFDIELIAIEPP